MLLSAFCLSFGFLFHYLSFFFLSLLKNCSQSFHTDMLMNEAQRGSLQISRQHSAAFFMIVRLALQRRCSIEIISSLHAILFTRTLSDHEVLTEFKWAKCLQRAWRVCLKPHLTQCCSSLCVLCIFVPGKPVSCLMVYPFHHLISPCPSRPGYFPLVFLCL